MHRKIIKEQALGSLRGCRDRVAGAGGPGRGQSISNRSPGHAAATSYKYHENKSLFDKEIFFQIFFSSVAQSCPTLCDPMNCSTPGLPVHHQLPEFTQTHVHRVGDAIQPSHPLLSPSPPAPNPSQHQSLFQWVNPLHEVSKVLEFQL